MNMRRYIANNISSIMSLTPVYRLKIFLYLWCGYPIHRSARILSSARIWGAGVVSIEHVADASQAENQKQD